MRTCFIRAFVRMPLFCLLVFSPLTTAGGAGEQERELTFQEDILSIVRAKCIRCHAGVEPKAGLNLTNSSALLSGGDTGPAIRIGAAEFSLLYEMVSSDKMPPVGQKLTAEEKGVIRSWINAGAKGIDFAASIDQSEDLSEVEHWSFYPPVRPDVPVVNEHDRVRNPIDAFIFSHLEANKLTMAPQAARLTLLRRASFDLTGLPPSPEEVDHFLNDEHQLAYERMIDRLLASPQYGERWGRHWLDVAGYADSAGILSEDRPLPLAWRYRDYVIRAFNSDKPYDRFLQEQIAGDELTDYWTAYENMDRLPADVVEGITATGFLRTAADASRPDFSTIKNAAAQYYYPTMFDTLQIVCSSTMGLTVQCARCHSHKFDAISQADYFRMLAVFSKAFRPDHWVPQMERRLLIASKKEKDAADQRNAEVNANIEKLKAEQTALKTAFSERLFNDRLADIPEAIRADVKAALETQAEARTEVQKYLVDKFEASLRPQDKDLDAALNEFAEYKTGIEDLNTRITTEERRRWLFDEIRAVYDLPGDVTTPVLLRGDPLTPGPPVEPGAITTLGTPSSFEWVSADTDAKTSGRRLAFARWLTQPDHPLTARVMVNRIWMHHFGTGIVATPHDFGIAGATPTHPELLDWLATEFVRSGWSIKHMHRLILTSSTWMQQSRVSAEFRMACESIDPDNHLLWRQSMRRIEAEPLRDALLATSGTLSDRMYGSPHPVARQPDGEVIVSEGQDRNRRSIYIQILRLNPETMLQVFDQPAISINCTERSTSTVSTQALTLLNSDVMTRAATAFAAHVLAECPDDPIEQAVMLAFARPADSNERELLARFVEAQTALYLSQQDESTRTEADVISVARRHAIEDVCHMLLSSNEFVYVD